MGDTKNNTNLIKFSLSGKELNQLGITKSCHNNLFSYSDAIIGVNN